MATPTEPTDAFLNVQQHDCLVISVMQHACEEDIASITVFCSNTLWDSPVVTRRNEKECHVSLQSYRLDFNTSHHVKMRLKIKV